MLKKIVHLLAHPKDGWYRILRRIHLLQVKRIEIHGEVFHRFKGVLYPDRLNQGNGCAIIADRALTYCSGIGLDIGASKWPLPGAIPVRDEPEQNAYSLGAFKDASLDFVFSSHCLEHLDQWQKALELWIRKLKVNGILFLYLPHESMKLWHPGGAFVGENHRWKPTHRKLIPFLRRHNLEIVDYNTERDDFWSFHIIAKKIS